MNLPLLITLLQFAGLFAVCYTIGILIQSIRLRPLVITPLQHACAPVLGLSILAYQLWAYGIVHIPWHPLSLLLPWAALLILQRVLYIHILKTLIRNMRTEYSRLDSFSTVLLVTAIIFSGAFLLRLITQPFFSSDVFAIWGLKAKEFYVHGAVYISPQFYEGDVMSKLLHVEYPPLIPLMTDVAYTIFGGINESLMKCISVIFLVSGVSGVYALVRSFPGKLAKQVALPAAFIVLATPQLLPVLFNSQYMAYADYGLSMIMLLGTLFLMRSFASQTPNSDWFLAFYFAGVAALSKNEGLSFLFSISIVLGLRCIFYVIQTRPKPSTLSRYAAIVLISVIPLILWWQFKRTYGLEIDFRAENLHDAGVSWTSRLHTVLNELFIFIKPHTYLHWQLVGLLIGGVMACWYRTKPALALLFILAVQLTAYITSYVLSPFDPHYHVFSSFDRLLIQVLPLTVLLLVTSFSVSTKKHT